MGHHLTNNVFHAINTFLVVLLVVKLIKAVHDSPFTIRDSRLTSHYSRFALIAAATTGLLFGLHPIHVESVAWIAERKDLLCALFYLLSVMAYVKYRTYKSYTTYFLSLGFFFLALLSKPMAVSLPVVLLILDWYPFQKITSLKTFRTAFVEKLPFIALSSFSSIVTILAQGSAAAIRSAEFAPLSTRSFSAVKALAAYLYKIILPLNLLPFYPYALHPSSLFFEYLLPIVLAIGITAGCISLAGRREKFWLCGWTYYVATLLPVLGIVQVGDQAMAVRYMYLPSLGPFLVIGLTAAWGWEKVAMSKNRRFIGQLVYAGTALFVLVLISYLTCRQVGIWDNSFTLWNYVIEKEPAAVPAAYNNRGIAFGRTGQLNRAIQDFDRAIVLDPSFDRAYNNRGAAYLMQRSFDKAIEDFDKAINIRAGNPSAYSNRGYAYYFEGQYDRAMKDYDKAIELDKNYAKAYFNRGNLYFRTGDNEPAISDFKKACELGDKEGCSAFQSLPR